MGIVIDLMSKSEDVFVEVIETAAKEEKKEKPRDKQIPRPDLQIIPAVPCRTPK